jgi:hypothetical protein
MKKLSNRGIIDLIGYIQKKLDGYADESDDTKHVTAVDIAMVCMHDIVKRYDIGYQPITYGDSKHAMSKQLSLFPNEVN